MKTKKKRSYNLRRIKQNATYTMDEAANLLSIHEGTVRGWLREGLPKIDFCRPYLILGRHLIYFLRGRQKRRRHKCAANEFYCFKCRVPRKAKIGSVRLRIRNEAKLLITGECVVCGTEINRAGTVARRAEYEETFCIERKRQQRIRERGGVIYMSHLQPLTHGGKYENVQRKKRAS